MVPTMRRLHTDIRPRDTKTHQNRSDVELWFCVCFDDGHRLYLGWWFLHNIHRLLAVTINNTITQQHHRRGHAIIFQTTCSLPHPTTEQKQLTEWTNKKSNRNISNRTEEKLNVLKEGALTVMCLWAMPVRTIRWIHCYGRLYNRESSAHGI